MDQTIVDVTDSPSETGQIATLIGTDGNASIEATQYADFSESIPYESLAQYKTRATGYKFAE